MFGLEMTSNVSLRACLGAFESSTQVSFGLIHSIVAACSWLRHLALLYILGTGNAAAVDLAGLCYTCAGTMMTAASANSLNQIFEISNDAKMKRTMKRPLPSGRIGVPHAVAFATIAGTSGACLLASKTYMMAAGLASANLVLYAFVYTPLKQLHPVNTWVGAVVGAIPPLLGWAAASGQISLNSLILPAALYFWQIPHFMALAHLCRNDYAAGGEENSSSGHLGTAFTWSHSRLITSVRLTNQQNTSIYKSAIIQPGTLRHVERKQIRDWIRTNRNYVGLPSFRNAPATETRQRESNLRDEEDVLLHCSEAEDSSSCEMSPASPSPACSSRRPCSRTE
ncbi:Heme O synthase [Raphanus sativus]|nr:Heme O synthase [Raphanus sativus]